MAFIIRDTNPQYGGQCYFVGTRQIRDPHGNKCEAADFGDRANAKKYSRRADAEERMRGLNKMAGHTQFVVEEESIYAQQYGRRRQATNGFNGFGTLPSREPEYETAHGGFVFDDGDGYNGF